MNRKEVINELIGVDWPNRFTTTTPDPPIGWGWSGDHDSRYLRCDNDPSIICREDVPVPMLRNDTIEYIRDQLKGTWPTSGNMKNVLTPPTGWKWFIHNNRESTVTLTSCNHVNRDTITKEHIYPAPPPAKPTKIDGVRHASHHVILEDTETIEMIARMLNRDQWYGYCYGNITKYRMRAGKKSSESMAKDIGKADEHVIIYEQFKGLNRND